MTQAVIASPKEVDPKTAYRPVLKAITMLTIAMKIKQSAQ
ncbi:hypothetical protein CCACVL1_12307 [Corchorus capsularis]|uniref:Uncharacterized protein n=1 Tax=Corchorus capsularis TaxID=210143 RepID=A0A1R3IGQ2_COCAP|nr:hypothetical protein CCACVL1_12307 [Corchorus capsularis]